MKDFAALFNAVDQTTKTTVKVAALAEYFTTAAEEDRLWTVALFSGRRPKRAVTTTKLREWASEASGVPLWLFEDSYAIVGDLAETIALVWPSPRDHRTGPPPGRERRHRHADLVDQRPARAERRRRRGAQGIRPFGLATAWRYRAVPVQ